MKIILYATIFLYFFLPFQFALNPTDGFDIAIIRILIIFIILFYFAYLLLKRHIFIPRGWIVGFLIAFLMWTLFSLFFTPVPLWTLRKIIFLFSIVPITFVLIYLFVHMPHTKKQIITATVFGATLISLIGIVQFLLQFSLSLNTILYFWSRITPFFLGNTFSTSVITHNSWLVHVSSYDIMRAIAFFPDPHIFSFYLGLIAPFALGLFFITKQKLWIFCFMIIFIADLLTFSRGGYVGLFGGIILGTILLWSHIKTSVRHFMLLFLSSLVFLLAIPHNPITGRFLSSFDQSDHSNTHRIELWHRALVEINKRPLVGTGLGTYAHTINPRATYRTPIYAHNLILDITVELGFIGFFLFCGIFITTIYHLYRNKNDYIALFAIISIGIFFFHTLFDTPLFSVHVLPIILLIAAIASSYENKLQK